MESPRRSLQCSTCGAGNPLTSWAAEHGWFRCRHCESPGPVPGAGDFAIDGPEGNVTRVIRPGSSEFEIKRGFVLPLPRGLLGLAIADIVVTAVIVLLARLAPDAPEWIAIALYCSLGIGVALVMLGYYSKQRLELKENSIEAWWVTCGKAWHHRKMHTQRFEASVRTARPRGVVLSSRSRTIIVRLGNETSAQWLECEIARAVQDTRASQNTDAAIACPGCGGPCRQRTSAPQGRRCRMSALPNRTCADCRRHRNAASSAPSPRRATFDGLVAPAGEKEGDAMQWRISSWASRNPWWVPAQIALMLFLNIIILVSRLGRRRRASGIPIADHLGRNRSHDRDGGPQQKVLRLVLRQRLDPRRTNGLDSGFRRRFVALRPSRCATRAARVIRVHSTGRERTLPRR